MPGKHWFKIDEKLCTEMVTLFIFKSPGAPLGDYRTGVVKVQNTARFQYTAAGLVKIHCDIYLFCEQTHYVKDNSIVLWCSFTHLCTLRSIHLKDREEAGRKKGRRRQRQTEKQRVKEVLDDTEYWILRHSFSRSPSADRNRYGKTTNFQVLWEEKTVLVSLKSSTFFSFIFTGLAVQGLAVTFGSQQIIHIRKWKCDNALH